MVPTPSSTTSFFSRRRQTLAFWTTTAALCWSPCHSFSAGLKPAFERRRTTTGSPRLALIYGWDDTCDPESTSNSHPRVVTEFYTPETCSTSGVAVAQSLSYDPHRVSSLARLAVAFSPPERALALNQIETVQVLCVEQDRIDLQAIVCEDGGCVSLSVPIVFPQACGDDQWLEGCVTDHLETLDQSLPEHFLLTSASFTDFEDNSNVAFPSWWVEPTGRIQTECSSMRDILNEPDFGLEIGALAQESLNHHSDQQQQVVVVQMVKVAAVGPAGLLFRVQAAAAAANHGAAAAAPTVLDVFYPFGGDAVQSVEALRATVLGLVATAA